jgi:hypothetical protein
MRFMMSLMSRANCFSEAPFDHWMRRIDVWSGWDR